MTISRLFTISALIFIIAMLVSFLILVFEFGYGNADGIWLDLDIKSFTYNALLGISCFTAAIYLLSFANRHIQYIFSTLLATVILLVSLDAVCSWILSRSGSGKSLKSKIAQPFVRPDHANSFFEDAVLGIKAKPGWHFKWVPVKDNIRYDPIEITIDSLSRRVTPSSKEATHHNYAMFFGCSYTYGDGVSDDQTLPYYFQSISKDYQSYNYGYLAYSPLHMLARLQNQDISKQMKQKDGFAVYTLINDHLDRVIPATRWIELTKGKFPYFDDESLKTNGTFESKRRIYTFLVTRLQTSGIKQLLRWSYPKFYTQQHYQRIVNIIKQSRLAYQKQFGNDRFYVLIFPGNPLPDELRKLLQAERIKTLDYVKLIDLPKHMLPFDNAHPKASAYQAVAEKLKNDMDSLNVFRSIEN